MEKSFSPDVTAQLVSVLLLLIPALCSFEAVAIESPLALPQVDSAQCANNIDDDQDGLSDLDDPKCKLPGDNDESSFGSGVPGDDNNDPWSLDCWFDLNSGSGDDNCEMHACCMLEGPCPAEYLPFDPNQCVASQQCIEACAPQTRQECDCFGCCQICDASVSGCYEVFVNPSVSPACELYVIDDPSLCKPCSRNASCPVPNPLIFLDGFEELTL